MYKLTKELFDFSIEAPIYAQFLESFPISFSNQISQLAITPFAKTGLQLSIEDSFSEIIAKTENGFKEFSDQVKKEIGHLILFHPFLRNAFEDKVSFRIASEMTLDQIIRSNENENSEELLNQFYQRIINKEIDARLLDKLISSATAKKNNWASFEKLSPSQISFYKSKIRKLCDSFSTEELNTEPGLKSIIEKSKLDWQTTDSKIDWIKALRRFSNSCRITKLKNSYSKPSKRYGSIPGLKILNKKNLIVAIDISGSIQAADLKEFFREIKAMWKTGASIQIVEADYKVRNDYQFKGVVPTNITRGSSTDFNAVIDYTNDAKATDGLIYLTDGFAQIPKSKCHVPILWVISKKGLNKDTFNWKKLPGQKTKLS